MTTEPTNAELAEINKLAERMWSVHPIEIQDSGMTRAQWYAEQMQELFTSLREGERGWKLVPVEPDIGMLAAWWRQKNCGTQEQGEYDPLHMSDCDAYRAMLAAAPSPSFREQSTRLRSDPPVDEQGVGGEILPSVAYRLGKPTIADYNEAITDLLAAKHQLQSGSLMGCDICGDSGHAAQDGCHHDVLLLARQWAQATAVYRCYHCGFVATNDDEAREHFGKNEFDDPTCAPTTVRARALEEAVGTAPGLAVLREALSRSPTAVADWVRISPAEASTILKAFHAIRALGKESS